MVPAGPGAQRIEQTARVYARKETMKIGSGTC
jgi:hypothetical protein